MILEKSLALLHIPTNIAVSKQDRFQTFSGFMDPNPRDLDHCRIIPLEDIIQATNNFAEENIIVKDFRRTVYKGELSGKTLAFILVNKGYRMYMDRVNSLPKHQNIVPFIGCCDKDSEMIFVFEHPSRGSLDKYVSSAHLTWLMRVRICLNIASALQYLQNHDLADVKVLNSANIQLDENWQAKIQSIIPLSQFSKWDWDYFFPEISETQSDIYYFGVILFELLCARLEDEQVLSKLARSHYEKGNLTEIIDPILRVQMNRDSFTVFSEIAYACLDENQDKQPTITKVVEELQKVLRLQQGIEISEIQQIR